MRKAEQKGAIALQEFGESRARPTIKEIVAEASRALAHLNACRLQELALSCQALNRDWAETDRAELAVESREAVSDMVVFARVLEATRANLNVMNRLRELREGRSEYGLPRMQSSRRMESWHGDN